MKASQKGPDSDIRFAFLQGIVWLAFVVYLLLWLSTAKAQSVDTTVAGSTSQSAVEDLVFSPSQTLDANGNWVVAGNANITGTLQVNGATTLTGLTNNGALQENGNTVIVGNANVTGTTALNGNVLLGSGVVLSWGVSSLQVQGISSPGNLLRLFGPSFPGFLVGGTSDSTGVTFQFVGTQTSGAGATLAYGQLSGGALGTVGSLGMKEVFTDYIGSFTNKLSTIAIDSSANVGFYGTGGAAGTNTGSTMNLKTVSANTTLSGATTTVTTIPAGALVMAVTCRVTTTITGATTWSIGDGTTATRWASAKALTSGTTSTAADYAASAVPALFTGSTTVVATANGSNFTGGVLRCVAYYFDVSAPTG